MKNAGRLAFVCAALSLSTATGCSLLSKAVQDSADSRQAEEVAELEANDKYEGLSELCKERKRGACDAKDRVAAKRLAASGCEDLEANVKAYYSNHDGTREGDAKLVGRFEQCDKMSALFTQDFRIRWLPEALTTVDAATGNVFDPFIEHVQAGGAKDTSGEFANRWARWLVAAGDASRCETLDANWEHFGSESSGQVLWTYYELGCGTQAAPRARARVTSQEPGRRGQACDVLGKFGTEADLEPLEILSQTDPQRAERELQASNGAIAIEVYYPIRERCEAAAGQVRLRASTARASGSGAGPAVATAE